MEKQNNQEYGLLKGLLIIVGVFVGLGIFFVILGVQVVYLYEASTAPLNAPNVIWLLINMFLVGLMSVVVDILTPEQVVPWITYFTSAISSMAIVVLFATLTYRLVIWAEKDEGDNDG